MGRRLWSEAWQLVARLDAELERYEDDGDPLDGRYGKLKRAMYYAELRLYRRGR